MEDKKLICKDCGKEFIWTIGEQNFFQSKGFTTPPIRCLECRKKKKARQEQNVGRIPRPVYTGRDNKPQKMSQIKCKKCAKMTEVPFEPRFPNDTLCAECFYKEQNKENKQ